LSKEKSRSSDKNDFDRKREETREPKEEKELKAEEKSWDRYSRDSRDRRDTRDRGDRDVDNRGSGRHRDNYRDSFRDSRDRNHGSGNQREEEVRTSRKNKDPEECRRKLEEMENNAKEHKEARAGKVKRAQEERVKELEEVYKAAEAKGGSARTGAGPSFLTSLSKTVYEDASTARVEDRVKRARYYQQKETNEKFL